MPEEKKELNEELLTKVTGGEGSGSQKDDDIVTILEDILEMAKDFFTPEREDRYPDVKRLHQSIEIAISASSYTFRKIQVHRALRASENLTTIDPFPSNPILYEIRNKLQEVEEMLK